MISLRRGDSIFRFDTFGDEQFWTDVLRMHEVIAAITLNRAGGQSQGRRRRTAAPVIAALKTDAVDFEGPGRDRGPGD